METAGASLRSKYTHLSGASEADNIYFERYWSRPFALCSFVAHAQREKYESNLSCQRVLFLDS